MCANTMILSNLAFRTDGSFIFHVLSVPHDNKNVSKNMFFTLRSLLYVGVVSSEFWEGFGKGVGAYLAFLKRFLASSGGACIVNASQSTSWVPLGWFLDVCLRIWGCLEALFVASRGGFGWQFGLALAI